MREGVWEREMKKDCQGPGRVFEKAANLLRGGMPAGKVDGRGVLVSKVAGRGLPPPFSLNATASWRTRLVAWPMQMRMPTIAPPSR